MDRRDFLKGMFGAVAVSAIPTPVLAAFIEEQTNIITCGNWEIDVVAKTIEWVGAEGQTTLVDLYCHVKDATYPMDELYPMIAHTPSSFRMVDGWYISKDSMQHLKEGSLSQIDKTGKEEVWCAIL